MKLSKIGIRVLVNDFQKCFDFYTQKLGFEVFWGDRDGPYASFKADGHNEPCFEIFLAKNMKIHEGYIPLKGSGKTDNNVYVIPSDNLEEDYRKLKQRGVVFIENHRQ